MRPPLPAPRVSPGSPSENLWAAVPRAWPRAPMPRLRSGAGSGPGAEQGCGREGCRPLPARPSPERLLRTWQVSRTTGLLAVTRLLCARRGVCGISGRDPARAPPVPRRRRDRGVVFPGGQAAPVETSHKQTCVVSEPFAVPRACGHWDGTERAGVESAV